RRSCPSLCTYVISRADAVHHSRISKSHAREQSTAQKSRNPTRGSSPSLGNREISRAGAVHRSGIVQSHAREQSTAQELRNLTRGNSPSLRNREIPRAGHIFLYYNKINDYKSLDVLKFYLIFLIFHL